MAIDTDPSPPVTSVGTNGHSLQVPSSSGGRGDQPPPPRLAGAVTPHLYVTLDLQIGRRSPWIRYVGWDMWGTHDCAL